MVVAAGAANVPDAEANTGVPVFELDTNGTSLVGQLCVAIPIGVPASDAQISVFVSVPVGAPAAVTV